MRPNLQCTGFYNMDTFYIFLGAIVLIIVVNFFQNAREKKFITPKKKDKGQSFSELLNYYALVDDGIILTTEGTLRACRVAAN